MTGDAPALPSLGGFARELTPTWLATTALLAGQRPPDLARVGRYVHLGCGAGETVAVVAANHPNTEVWAWDQHPEHLHATRRLGDAAGFDNLAVHEPWDLPLDLGGGPADVIVVQDVLSAVDDDLRARIAAAVRTTLRPGGLLCVTYPTLAGWVEIAPVQVLMRQLAIGHLGSPEELVPQVLGTLERLRSGGARFLTERPVVAAWLDGLAALDPDEVVARYLRGPFRPLSPAQVAAAFTSTGCELIGSAQLTDDLALEPALEDAVAAGPSRVVRETYRDLATRRSYRVDLFALGGTALTSHERDERLAQLSLAGLAGAEEPPATSVDRDTWRQLTSFGAAAGELHPDPDEVVRLLRILMDAGQVHPVVTNGPRRGALEACDALNAVLADAARAERRPDPLCAVPLLGSAVSSARASAMRAIPSARGAG